MAVVSLLEGEFRAAYVFLSGVWSPRRNEDSLVNNRPDVVVTHRNLVAYRLVFSLRTHYIDRCIVY